MYFKRNRNPDLSGPSIETRIARKFGDDEWLRESASRDRQHALKRAGLKEQAIQEARQERWTEAYRGLFNKTDFIGVVAVHSAATQDELAQMAAQVLDTHLGGPNVLLVVSGVRGLRSVLRDRHIGETRRGLAHAIKFSGAQPGNGPTHHVEDCMSTAYLNPDVLCLSDAVSSNEGFVGIRYRDQVAGHLMVASPSDAEAIGASPNREHSGLLQIMSAIGPEYGNITWALPGERA